MKILIGGVPFGRNNVGDEAILECVIRLLHSLRPDGRLTVSTDDRTGTETKFGVRTVPLFGFEPPYDEGMMESELAGHDVFFWAGATGLSDYPEIPCRMLRVAQAAGRQTIVWNVGMNDELNPAKYTLGRGRKRRLLELAGRLTLGAWDGVTAWETNSRQRARGAIAGALAACDLVVTRDPESREELIRAGVTRPVLVGADTALLQEAIPDASLRLDDHSRALLFGEGPKFGLCISAQREVKRIDELAGMLDRVIDETGAALILIPMNPITDAKLMDGLRAKLSRPERACLIKGRREPEEILAVARHLDAVASSRLHLLILSSIFDVPIIGISRGSKVDNFLAPYGLKAVGTVEECDFDAFRKEIVRFLGKDPTWASRAAQVRHDLLARLETATRELDRVLPAI